MKFLIFLVVLFAADMSRGQQSPPQASPPPDSLIVPHMPASSRWTITYIYTDAEKDEATLGRVYAESVRQRALADPTLAKALAANPGLLVRPSNVRQRTITKGDSVRAEVTLYTDGQKSEIWFFGNKMVKRDAVTGKFSLENSKPVSAEPDFPELAWINKQNFNGIQTIKGEKCLVFVAKIDPMQVDDPRLFAAVSGREDPDVKVPVTATVDFDTRQPVSVAYQNRAMTYQVLAGPGSELVVPPEFVAAAEEVEKRTRIRNAPLSPP